MAKRNTLGINVVADITQAERELKRLEGVFKRTGKSIGDVGSGFALLTAPLVAVGAVAAKAALDIDDALDKIRSGTGATGAALEGLEVDFRAVASTVPQTFDETATAIADLNTRLGLSGAALQDAAKAALDASRLMGTNLTETIRQSTRAMQNWNIPAAEATATLDKLFVASQQSGIGMDALGGALAQYGPILRSMGLGMDRSIALMASFEKQGVNVEAVMAGLKRALASMAKDGMGSDQALDRIIAGIRGAGTAAEAAKRAVSIFGARSGPELAAAIREGRFSVEEMERALKNAGGAIQATARDTDGFAEQWKAAMNAASLALEPLGAAILAVAEDHLPKLGEALRNTKLESSKSAVEIGLLVSGIAAGTMAAGAFVGSLSTIIRSLKTMAGAVASVNMALSANPIWALGAAGASAVVLGIQTGKEIGAYLDPGTYQPFDPKAPKGDPSLGNLVRGATTPEAPGSMEDLLRGRNRTPAVSNDSKLAPIVSLGGGKKKQKQGPSETEKLVERIRDSMTYLGADGRDYIKVLDQWQAKLKPLSEDWKRVADLQTDIREEASRRVGAETAAAIQASEAGRAYDDQLKAAKGVDDALTRQKDTAAAIAKFWDLESLGNRLGLLPDEAYLQELEAEFRALSEEMSGSGLDMSNWQNWTDEMLARFGDIQEVAGRIAGVSLEGLQAQWQNGILSADGYRVALEGLLQKFQQYPAVTKQIETAIKGLDEAVAASTISMARLTREAETALKDKLARVPDDLSACFASAVVNSDNLGDALRNLAKEVAALALKALFLKSLGGLFGNLFGGGSLGAAVSSGGGGSSWMGGSGGVSMPSVGSGLSSRSGFTPPSDGDAERGQTIVHMHIQAVDAPSFVRMLESNRAAIEGVVVQSLQRNGPLRAAVRSS